MIMVILSLQAQLRSLDESEGNNVQEPYTKITFCTSLMLLEES